MGVGFDAGFGAEDGSWWLGGGGGTARGWGVVREAKAGSGAGMFEVVAIPESMPPWSSGGFVTGLEEVTLAKL